MIFSKLCRLGLSALVVVSLAAPAHAQETPALVPAVYTAPPASFLPVVPDPWQHWNAYAAANALPGGQDITSLLSHFLVDLRAGNLGVNQAITQITVGTVKAGAGAAGTPSLTFSAQTDLGFFKRSSTTVDFVTQGVGMVSLSAATNGLTLASGARYMFSSALDPDAGPDAGFSRLGAGSVALGNGTASDFSAALKLTTLNAVTGLQINGAAAAGNYLVGNGTNFVSLAPALNKAQPADQTARSSSGGTFVMMGLGAAVAPCTITPTMTGRVVFVISGDIVNNTSATTVTIKMAESTGSAPANNASASGTVISSAIVVDGLTTALTVPFSITSSATGLALSTAVWFDLQLTTSSTNTGQPTNVTCVAYEL